MNFAGMKKNAFFADLCLFLYKSISVNATILESRVGHTKTVVPLNARELKAIIRCLIGGIAAFLESMGKPSNLLAQSLIR